MLVLIDENSTIDMSVLSCSISVNIEKGDSLIVKNMQIYLQKI